MDDKVLDHSLEGLLPNIGGEYGLVLQTMETLTAKYFLCDRIGHAAYCYNLVLVRLLVHSHALFLPSFFMQSRKTY